MKKYLSTLNISIALFILVLMYLALAYMKGFYPFNEEEYGWIQQAKCKKDCAKCKSDCLKLGRNCPTCICPECNCDCDKL